MSQDPISEDLLTLLRGSDEGAVRKRGRVRVSLNPNPNPNPNPDPNPNPNPDPNPNPSPSPIPITKPNQETSRDAAAKLSKHD
jgi:hypothetical protein